jgi:hypothetical protein
MKILDIQPITLSVGNFHSLTATKLQVLADYRLFDESAIVRYHLLSDEHTVVFADGMNLIGDELANWGTDDNYIVGLVVAKLGITLI